MENYKQEIGLRLKQIRKEKGMTQEKISELLGISQKHYSEVERGITGLSVKHFIQISNILSVSLDYLLKGVVSETASETAKMNLSVNKLYYASSEYTQKQMLKLLQIAKDIEDGSHTSKQISDHDNARK